MPMPDIPEGAPIWQQLGYGLILGLAGIGFIARQMWAGKKDAEKESPKALQAFEVADMGPVRELTANWKDSIQKLDLLLERQADIA